MIKKIQISDASIAEEIRNNMAVATHEKKGLMSSLHAPYEYTGSGVYDLNDIRKESRLYVPPTVINSPTSEWGICLVFIIGGSYTVQWFIEYFGSSVSYVRTYNTGVWRAWKKIW